MFNFSASQTKPIFLFFLWHQGYLLGCRIKWEVGKWGSGNGLFVFVCPRKRGMVCMGWYRERGKMFNQDVIGECLRRCLAGPIRMCYLTTTSVGKPLDVLERGQPGHSLDVRGWMSGEWPATIRMVLILTSCRSIDSGWMDFNCGISVSLAKDWEGTLLTKQMSPTFRFSHLQGDTHGSI
jgi:hypothetical protein